MAEMTAYYNIKQIIFSWLYWITKTLKEGKIHTSYLSLPFAADIYVFEFALNSINDGIGIGLPTSQPWYEHQGSELWHNRTLLIQIIWGKNNSLAFFFLTKKNLNYHDAEKLTFHKNMLSQD